MTLDNDILFFVNRTLSNPVLDTFCPILRNKLTWIPLYIVLAFILLKRDSKSGLIWITMAVLTVVISDQIGLLFKNYFERIRPCANEDILKWLIVREPCSHSFSFISSHAANHFAQAFLYHHIFKNKIASLLFFSWAFLIGFSQIYVGLHFPSDVIAGGILGILVGWAMSNLGELFHTRFERPRNQKF